MRNYELMVILDPSIDERTVAPTMDKYLAPVSANGGSVPDGSSSGSQSSGGADRDDHNEVVVGGNGGQDGEGRTSAAERSSAKDARERWLPVTGVAIGVLSMAAILLSGGLIVLRLRRG